MLRVSEYAFYAYFCLSLLCIVSVLGAERLRAAGHGLRATSIDRWTRVAFLTAVTATVIAAFWLYGGALR